MCVVRPQQGKTGTAKGFKEMKIKILVESEDDGEEDSEEDSEEEKGKTWEELEREASNADREKGNESDSEEDRKRRKAKSFGKSRGAGLSSSMTKRPKLR